MAKSKKSPTTPMTTLQNVARQARTHSAKHLLACGLYPGQETIIQLLAENDAMTPSHIAQAIGVRPPTITKSIGRLVEQGFVARSVNPADGRQVHVQLTESGNNILNKAYKSARRAERQSLKKLKPHEVDELKRLLSIVGSTLDKRAAKAAKKASKAERQKKS